MAHEANVSVVGMWASFCQLDTNLNISGRKDSKLRTVLRQVVL